MNWPSASSETGTIATAEPATRPYVGRFAPSPTGPLHFGSLLAAVASYLEARRGGGRWLVRIEDIDPPREEAGAADRIVRALEQLGFQWDDAVTYQSASRQAHLQALERLRSAGLTYPCSCSRSDLAGLPRGPLGPIYPGYCRSGNRGDDYAIRVRTSSTVTSFDDRLQGRQAQMLETESWDFIVRRRDGLVAYHLAVVVDDALQGVTEIVRGIDLMPSTPRQLWLQHLLDLPSPVYAHIPVAVDREGNKLSKSHGAAPVSTGAPAPLLAAALEALGLSVPRELVRASVADIWGWAVENWDMTALQGRRRIPVDGAMDGGTQEPKRI